MNTGPRALLLRVQRREVEMRIEEKSKKLVPFVWLLFFWTRRFHFYDHTVFVTYSLAFMSLLAVALTVLGFAGVWSGVIASAAIFIPPVHMFRQLKQAYQLHWASALLRTFLLLNFCVITASLFFVLLLGIGARG